MLGRYIEALAGRFITMVDVGTTPEDMEQLRSTTRFVVGRPIEEGGSGEPSPMTALGVLSGMKALVEDVLERETLAGVRVAIQGLGKVGMNLARLLLREGAAVIGSDVRPQAIEEARKRLEIEVIEPEAIYEVPCDVFAPCALGAVLNDLTIPRLRCRIVAGGANNQLEAERHAEVMQARQIVYAVDYVINVGGLINVAGELDGYDAEKVKAKTVQIYHTIKRMQEIARAEGITTQRAAQRMARAILEGASK